MRDGIGGKTEAWPKTSELDWMPVIWRGSCNDLNFLDSLSKEIMVELMSSSPVPYLKHKKKFCGE